MTTKKELQDLVLSHRFTPVNTPCQDTSVNKDIFFPDPTDYDMIAEAKSLCSKCNQQTKSDCLSFGLATKSLGVWGGTTELERKSIARRKARKNGKV